MEPAGSIFGTGMTVKMWEGAERVDVRVYRHDGEGYFCWEDVRVFQATGSAAMFEAMFLGHLVRILVPYTSIMDVIFHKRSDVGD